jgi:AraC-like DNA-binding protein
MMLASAVQAPPPPPWAFRFRSDDLDEVRAIVGRVDMPHTRVGKQRDAIGYDFYCVLGTDVAVGVSSGATAQTVRGQVASPVLHLMPPPGSVYRLGRRVLATTDESSAVIVAPELEFTRTSPPGTMLSIKIDQAALLREIKARRPSAEGAWVPRLELLTLTQAQRADLIAATADLVRLTEPGTDARHQAHAESRVVAGVADLMPRDVAATPAGTLALARAIDLEGWIDAHLDEPLSLGWLCEVAGVGARCLQKTFESRRGMSPMRFVTERRLIAAHDRLNQASLCVSVTRTATDLGFDHLGRFSHMYRQVIGETPSQTLAARRRSV